MASVFLSSGTVFLCVACVAGEGGEFLRSGLAGVAAWGCGSTCVWPPEAADSHSAACSGAVRARGNSGSL